MAEGALSSFQKKRSKRKSVSNASSSNTSRSRRRHSSAPLVAPSTSNQQQSLSTILHAPTSILNNTELSPQQCQLQANSHAPQQQQPILVPNLLELDAFLTNHRPMICVADYDKDIILQRMEKEICSRFCLGSFSTTAKHARSVRLKRKKGRRTTDAEDLSHSSTAPTKSTTPATTNAVKQRILLGVTQCTRALLTLCERNHNGPITDNPFATSADTSATHENDSNSSSSLLIIASDVRPPTILHHILCMAIQLSITILMIPGRASLDMGNVWGIKSVGVMLFLPPTPHITTATVSSEDATYLAEQKLIEKCHRDVNSFIDFVVSKLPKL